MQRPPRLNCAKQKAKKLAFIILGSWHPIFILRTGAMAPFIPEGRRSHGEVPVTIAVAVDQPIELLPGGTELMSNGVFTIGQS